MQKHLTPRTRNLVRDDALRAAAGAGVRGEGGAGESAHRGEGGAAALGTQTSHDDLSFRLSQPAGLIFDDRDSRVWVRGALGLDKPAEVHCGDHLLSLY